MRGKKLESFCLECALFYFVYKLRLEVSIKLLTDNRVNLSYNSNFILNFNNFNYNTVESNQANSTVNIGIRFIIMNKNLLRKCDCIRTLSWFSVCQPVVSADQNFI